MRQRFVSARACSYMHLIMRKPALVHANKNTSGWPNLDQHLYDSTFVRYLDGLINITEVSISKMSNLWLGSVAE